MHRTGMKKPDTSVGMLAQALGDLPLAMEQAAACIERTRIDFNVYLKRFETHWAELLGQVKTSGEYPDSVEMTWEISFRQLQEEAPEAADLLNLLSFLGPDAIPRSLIRAGAVTLPEGLANIVMDELRLAEAIASLRTYSLIEDDGQVTSVHRLVGTLVRDRLDEGERAKWAEAAIKMIVIAFKFDSADLASWDKCAELLPHALAAAWHAEANGIAARATITVLDDAGRYLMKRRSSSRPRVCSSGRWGLASTVLRRGAPAGCRRSPTTSAASTASSATSKRRGHAFERSMAIDQEVYGEADPHLAAVFNNYGIVLQEAGDAEGARQQFEWALTVYKTHYGEDHPKIASIVNNLGYVARGAGDLAGGREQFEKALGIARTSYGENHPTVASILINLGMVKRLSGDLPGAKADLERALEICESVSGPSHPTVARACGHLGAVMQDMGSLGGARMYFERAFAGRRGVLRLRPPQHRRPRHAARPGAASAGGQGRRASDVRPRDADHGTARRSSNRRGRSAVRNISRSTAKNVPHSGTYLVTTSNPRGSGGAGSSLSWSRPAELAKRREEEADHRDGDERPDAADEDRAKPVPTKPPSRLTPGPPSSLLEPMKTWFHRADAAAHGVGGEELHEGVADDDRDIVARAGADQHREAEPEVLRQPEDDRRDAEAADGEQQRAAGVAHRRAMGEDQRHGECAEGWRRAEPAEAGSADVQDVLGEYRQEVDRAAEQDGE
jgi:Tfp pilus assembly protein PilF